MEEKDINLQNSQNENSNSGVINPVAQLPVDSNVNVPPAQAVDIVLDNSSKTPTDLSFNAVEPRIDNTQTIENHQNLRLDSKSSIGQQTSNSTCETDEYYRRWHRNVILFAFIFSMYIDVTYLLGLFGNKIDWSLSIWVVLTIVFGVVFFYQKVSKHIPKALHIIVLILAIMVDMLAIVGFVAGFILGHP